MKYIEKFSSLIPALQGNKITRMIEEKREKGELQTELEYNNALEEILAGISTTEFKPLFEYTPIQPGLSSSEQFNEMMDRIRDDLEVVFIELNNIFAAIKAHDTIFRDKLLDELRFTLKELEDEAGRLSIIGSAGNSFDDVSLNTFNGDNYLLDQGSEFANELFFDRRIDSRILDGNLGFVDSQEQVLSLPLATQEDIAFNSASVRTAESTPTEVSIELIDSSIRNILDQDSSSAWTYNVLVKELIKGGAKLSLELDLGDKRRVNYLKIHPISDFPVFLEKIEYINENNNRVDLPDTTFFSTTIDNPIRVTFPDVVAKRFIITMNQGTSVLFDYDQNEPPVTFDDLRRNTNVSRSASLLTDNIRDTIEDPDLLNVMPLVPNISPNYFVYNQYTFGFKDISAGLSSYLSNGYYVTKSYPKDSVALIGLQSSENIPEYFDEEAGANALSASFEYSIVKKDYNGAGNIVRSYSFPVLPIGQSMITNERLFFTGQRKIVPLRFIGHLSNGDGSLINIYRNNVLLTRGVDWRFFDRLNPVDNSDSTLQPSLDSTRIEILNSDDTIRTAIYTAEYVPRYISEPDSVTKSGNVIYLSSGATEHSVSVGSETVERSDIFLKIAIRNNSFLSNLTPKLDFYRLLTSSVDSDKYVRI